MARMKTLRLAMMMTGFRMYEVQHILPQSGRSGAQEKGRRGGSFCSVKAVML